MRAEFRSAVGPAFAKERKFLSQTQEPLSLSFVDSTCIDDDRELKRELGMLLPPGFSRCYGCTQRLWLRAAAAEGP